VAYRCKCYEWIFCFHLQGWQDFFLLQHFNTILPNYTGSHPHLIHNAVRTDDELLNSAEPSHGAVSSIRFQRRRKRILVSALLLSKLYAFEKYLKNFEASGFFIKILLRHETGWNSVNNSQTLRFVLEFSFYRWAEENSALKTHEQATRMSWVHEKLPHGARLWFILASAQPRPSLRL
jgi:hypothetical protein